MSSSFGWALALMIGMSVVQAQDTPENKESKKKKEKTVETHAFLGVATSPMDPTLRTHLGLDPGVGLIIQNVDDDSPAAGVLEQHDVLLYLDDQLLINHDQLAVLVRRAGVGAKIRLTALRGGKELKKEVILGEREGPPQRDFRPFGPGGFDFDFFPPGGQRDGEWKQIIPNPLKNRDEKEEPEAMPEGATMKDPEKMGPLSVTAESTTQLEVPEEVRSHNAMWVSGDLIVNLTENLDGRRLKVMKEGKEIFNGPVETDEQVAEIPEEALPAYQSMTKQLRK